MKNYIKPNPPFTPTLRRILKKIIGRDRYQDFIGRHEKTTMYIWELIATDLNGKDAILDIGAYFGEFSIKARMKNSHVAIHAFEPNEDTLILLEESTNGLNINISNLAISDKCGKAVFSKIGEESSIISDREINSNTLEVETITLDYYQEKNNLKIKLIKIDTEGEEFKILKKSSNVLQKHKPIICCEVLTDKEGSKLTELLSKDYVFYHVDEKYKKISKKLKIDRKLWRNRNWFFVPIEKKAGFETSINRYKTIEVY